MKARQSRIGQVVEPRGLDRQTSASYIGVGTTKFDELVAKRQMPSPKLIGKRKVWDRHALDISFSELPDSDDDAWDKALGV